jgi:hypothetical protein
VKIRLKADRWDSAWGFRVDQIVNGEERPSLAESTHPYSNQFSHTWTLVNPNPAAAFSKVHFTRLNLNRGDSLVLFDGDDNRMQVFKENTKKWDFWSQDIPGRVVKIRLKTDRWDNAWGFRIDEIEPNIDTTPASAFVNGVYVYVGQPGEIYVNDVLKGHASAPGDYRIPLPGLPEDVITINTLFHTQDIVVNTDEDGTIRIEYSEPTPKQ